MDQLHKDIVHTRKMFSTSVTGNHYYKNSFYKKCSTYSIVKIRVKLMKRKFLDTLDVLKNLFHKSTNK